MTWDGKTRYECVKQYIFLLSLWRNRHGTEGNDAGGWCSVSVGADIEVVVGGYGKGGWRGVGDDDDDVVGVDVIVGNGKDGWCRVADDVKAGVVDIEVFFFGDRIQAAALLLLLCFREKRGKKKKEKR